MEKHGSLIIKLLLTAIIGFASFFYLLYTFLLLSAMLRLNIVITFAAMLIIPLLLFIVWGSGKRKKYFKRWLIYIFVVAIAGGINYGIIEYKESLRIRTDININVYDYMPFVKESTISLNFNKLFASSFLSASY